MEQKNYYGVLDSAETQMEKEHRKLAREAAAEGFVLLKNGNGALPLQNREIALYGMGARKTVKGGLGSGSVEERYSVNIEEGLENAGFTVTTKRWLDDYDAEYERTYREYREMVEEKVAGMTDAWKIIPLAHSYVYRFPSGRLITEQDVQESRTDTAVYVLMRQAGEGNDRKLEEGDYYLTQTERENLRMVSQSYAHTILIVNVGGPMDLGILDELPGIDAVVLFAQGGMEGGNALADVLSGRVNFSGKLTDTLPLSYEDIPFGEEFSYLNGDLENENYKEGIYVGYRYYDSFDKKVRFPFGFGLSYTTFAMETERAVLEGTKVTVLVSVRNTGAQYAGREVVQCYVSAPNGRLEREYQSLAAFAKTGELAPGESQQIELSFDLRDLAGYEEADASWILEQGEYIVRIGDSSRSTKAAAVIELEETATVRRCRSCCAPQEPVEELRRRAVSEGKAWETERPDGREAACRAENGSDCETAEVAEAAETGWNSASDKKDKVVRLYLDPSAISAEIVSYELPEQEESEAEKALLDSLTENEMASLLRGGNIQAQGEGIHMVLGAAGSTAKNLTAKGIGNAVFSDGPAGLNVTNRVCRGEDGVEKAMEVPERYRWGVLAKMPVATEADGTVVYRYASAWPVELLLAQSWNTELLRRIGEATAQEMTLFGVTLWLAPGMNIHRNPLGGRTFEYYSEDPLLSGRMAAALTQGVQKTPGCGVTVKHFCCNNTEDNRDHISSNVSERALREIYLKGFEIAVRESQPRALMSSYNLLNHVYTANRGDLLNDILRCEWGYQGIVMTDWSSTGEGKADPAKCPGAGNDLVMPGTPYDTQRMEEALADGTLGMTEVRRCALRILRLLREAGV
ncbi:MAG: glycoside hydrolase family 3 C-terminal domain-containing protein [Eubacteriales bacterium]|nr:glycoside hydrolase family 3 C-terminal domain-containing protein [Eubacteriales bacterium]